MIEILKISNATDYESWAQLYRGYGQFYNTPMPDEKLKLVWSWLIDPDHETCGLVATQGQTMLGLAHYRRFARPLAGEVGLFLDDLFTASTARGKGIGRQFLEELATIARTQGISKVRWITADDNMTARALYDQHALATSWVTYDLEA